MNAKIFNLSVQIEYYVKLYYKKMQHISIYEYTRIIGDRAEQLAQGSPPLCDIGDLHKPIAIAEKEFQLGVIPITIIRRLPNNEVIKVDLKPKLMKR